MAQDLWRRDLRIATALDESGKPGAVGLLGQDHARPGVVDHRRQAFIGKVRVQRQIGSSRLESAQQPDDP